jgi:ferredoxin
MMASVKRMLEELGVPSAQVHTEAFGPASLPAENAPEAATSAPVAAPPAVKAAAESGIAAATVTFAVSGVSAPLAADETILEAAEEAGVEIPYACRVGECGVCVTKLRSGEVTMAVETGLDPADKAQGYVLACQAKSAGGPLVVEA